MTLFVFPTRLLVEGKDMLFVKEVLRRRLLNILERIVNLVLSFFTFFSAATTAYADRDHNDNHDGKYGSTGKHYIPLFHRLCIHEFERAAGRLVGVDLENDH